MIRVIITISLFSWVNAFVLPSKSMASGSRRHTEPSMATRRQILPVALVSLLGGRIAVLASFKEEYQPPATTSFDPDQAIGASLAAGQCPVQSCNQARLAEMKYALNTDKANKMAKGSAKTHAPIVWVEPVRQEANRPYSAKVVMVAPEQSGDAVRLMWLVNQETKEIIGSHVGDSASDGPETLISTARTPFAGVKGGSTVLPFVLYANDGLWAGEPITLCGPESSRCPGALGPRDLMLDTRGRRLLILRFLLFLPLLV